MGATCAAKWPRGIDVDDTLRSARKWAGIVIAILAAAGMGYVAGHP